MSETSPSGSGSPFASMPPHPPAPTPPPLQLGLDPAAAPPTMPGSILVQQAGPASSLILILGISSIVMAAGGFLCGFTSIIGIPLGIVAWFWGSGELKKVRAGLQPTSVASSLQAGRICGIVGLVLSVLISTVMFFYLVLAIQGATAGP